MGCKGRMKNLCRVKYVIIFCLILLFIWWGRKAVLRYWSQPLSTDISFKYGEFERGIQFPLITLCIGNILVDNPMIKDCRDGSWNFIKTYVTCMKRNKTFHMLSFHPEIRNIVEMVQLWTGSEYINLHQFYGTVWTKVFHHKGPCYTFDISRVEKFKYILLNSGERPAIEFSMAENNPWKSVVLMLHTRFDLPVAYELNGYSFLSFLDETYKLHKVEFRKKIIKKETTRKALCVKNEYDTCQSIENNTVIFERFNCSVPILYSGPHLEDFIPKKATNCSRDVTLKALDFTSSKKSHCSVSPTCENVRFTTKYKVEDSSWVKNASLIFVSLENPEVEFHNTYISYDLQSLIGEIGGILGITLGASA